MWMKRVMQSFSFASSSSSVVSSLVVVVDDLRLLINKSLSLGVGIGDIDRIDSFLAPTDFADKTQGLIDGPI